MSHMCTHQLSYYLITDDAGGYLGNVSQLPTVIVQGKSENDIASKISKSTQAYLHHFRSEHARILKDLSSKISDSDFKSGRILGLKQFVVECNEE